MNTFFLIIKHQPNTLAVMSMSIILPNFSVPGCHYSISYSNQATDNIRKLFSFFKRPDRWRKFPQRNCISIKYSFRSATNILQGVVRRQISDQKVPNTEDIRIGQGLNLLRDIVAGLQTNHGAHKGQGHDQEWINVIFSFI